MVLSCEDLQVLHPNATISTFEASNGGYIRSLLIVAGQFLEPMVVSFKDLRVLHPIAITSTFVTNTF